MLVQFKVKNFRSFGEETTFSMVAAEENPLAELGEQYQHPSHLLDTPDPEVKLLRGAAIYGANASGKSNLVKAIHFLTNIISNSYDKYKYLAWSEDFFGAKEGGLIEFEVVFISKKSLYKYILKISWNIVYYEMLEKDEEVIFERDEENQFELKECFAADNKGIENGVLKWIDPSQTFLRESHLKGVKGLDAPYQFLANGFVYLGTSRIDQRLPYLQLASSQKIKSFINDVTLNSDFGVNAVKVERGTEITQPEMTVYNLRSRITIDGKTYGYTKFGDPYVEECGKYYLLAFSFQHGNENDNFELTPKSESEGTTAFIYLLSALYECVSKQKVLLIDELDLSLHTALCQHFIHKFYSSDAKQLIFNTHDTNLFSAKLFRPDELWLVRKRPDGVSIIDSLIDFKYEHLKELADDLEESYLFGRFGAIPKIHNKRPSFS